MKKLNVLHVSTLMNIGGVENRLIEYLNHSSGSDEFHHAVCCTSAVPDLVSKVRRSGAEVFMPKRRFHYDPSAILHMARYIKNNGFHIVHTRNCVSNCWGGLAAILANVPVKIASEHGAIWEAGPPTSWIERFNYRFYDLVLTNSEASKVIVLAKRGIEPAKTKVLYNGIDVRAYDRETDAVAKKRELAIPENHKIVGSIGRLAAQKGFSIFIDAAARILKDNDGVTFVLVGDGPLRDELESQVHEHGIEANFRFTGWRDDVADLLSVFDLFVSTSIWEPLGNVLMEAQLSGVPVIGPAVDGIVEVIQDGVTGVLVEPTDPIEKCLHGPSSRVPRFVVYNGMLSRPKAIDPAKLAKQTLRLLNRPDVCLDLVNNASERARRVFSLETYASQLNEVYLRLAKEKGII